MADVLSTEDLAAASRAASEGRIEVLGVRLRASELMRLVRRLPIQAGRRKAARFILDGVVVEGVCNLSGIDFGVAASFEAATFEGSATFRDTTFAAANFELARFTSGASFEHASFAGLADFASVDLAGEADFSGCVFGGPARFLRRFHVSGQASFYGAVFEAEAVFVGADFDADAAFSGATFADGAYFGGATFAGDAVFASVRFERDVDLTAVACGGELSLAHSRFHEARNLGPMQVEGLINLRRATFESPVRIEASAREIDCDRAMFHAGVDLFARSADICAEGTDFGGPSLLSILPVGTPTRDRGGVFSDTLPSGRSWAGTWDAGPRSAPRLISLRGAKVARLTLSRIDLAPCRFASAHGLSEMHLESVCFAQPPSGRRKMRRRWSRWTERRTIAEEHRWRRANGFGSGWYGEDVCVASYLDDGFEVLSCPEIASIYRSLRRGRERERDEPIAGDFLYGEMEMRRMHARRRGTWSFMPVRIGERAVMWLYWLVAGYGQRGSRALVALALVVAGLSIPLAISGFNPAEGYGQAVLFSTESSISPLHPPDMPNLTALGQVLQIVLRLAGPSLFGLAVLALRNRVKR